MDKKEYHRKASLKSYHNDKEKWSKRNREYHQKNKVAVCARHNARIRKNKIDFINYKGGKCSICGYDKCISALEFHHLSPELKNKSMTKQLSVYTLERAKAELDKCILICSNCHREIEEGI